MLETAKERYQRYVDAKNQLENWRSRICEVYKYVMPNRDDFFDRDANYPSNQGQSKTNFLFDTTAVNGCTNFANNLQSIMMPPFKRWMELQIGRNLKIEKLDASTSKNLKERLQLYTNILFQQLEASNFAMVSNEAFQDICIGTAVIALNELPDNEESVFEFVSVPIGHSVFEAGRFDRLENFWRWHRLSVRQLIRNWSQIELTPKLKRLQESNPQELVEVIEGAIIYPDNPESKRCYYYIQDIGEVVDLFGEWRSWSPFVGARYLKGAGEIVGRGVADLNFGLIKVLNKITEFQLRAMKFWAFPAYTADNEAVNTFNLRIEPGAIIPVNQMTSPPINPIPTGGQPQLVQLSINDLREILREGMLSTPLASVRDMQNRSATEVSLRYKDYVQRNGAAAGRLAREFINPILNKCLKILRNKGLITDVNVNDRRIEISTKNKNIEILYRSPLLSVQEQKDVEILNQWLTMIIQYANPESMSALLATQAFKIPMWAAEKLGVDLSLVENVDAFKEKASKLQKQIAKSQTAQTAMQGAAPAQQQPQQPAEQQGGVS